jgi:hypothetical protein
VQLISLDVELGFRAHNGIVPGIRVIENTNLLADAGYAERGSTLFDEGGDGGLTVVTVEQDSQDKQDICQALHDG